MAIKKFSIGGLDFTANKQVLTTENLSNQVVIDAITAVPQLRGATGATGLGATGATGVAGTPGAAGANGATGATGPAGAAGSPGSAGADGATGATGPQGATGIAGGATYTVTNSGASDYLVNGLADPTLNLLRGFTYYFAVAASGHPFWIKTAQVTGTGSAYSSGVTNNGTDNGTVTFTVPLDAPSTLYYICQFHGSMSGTLNISDLGPTGATGATGAAGSPGAAGADGATGATGPQGNIGSQGATGLTGATGTFTGFTVRSTFANNQPYVTVANVTALEFDDDSGFTVTNRGSGNVLVGMSSTFKYWEVTGSQQLVASGLDHITINSGNNIVITSNAADQPYQSITFGTTSNPIFNNVYASAYFYANGVQLAGNVSASGGGGGGAATTISSTAPANPVVGQFWIKDDTGELYVYYNDGDSFQWIQPVGGAGPTGATGPTGSPGGATGATGLAGPIGATGTPGATGLQGATGVAGAPGATGSTGVAGPEGATGATGVQGNVGPVGATGIQGNVGPQGATGPEFTISTGETPPVSPTAGSLWWASNIGNLFFYYNDGDSSQWVSAAVAVGSGSGGVGLGSRTTVTGNTASIANNTAGNVDVTGFKGYALYKIQTSHAAWVRIYTDTASRSADSSRAENTDPASNSGVIAEVITSAAGNVIIAPAALGFSAEATPTTNIPMAVTNKSGGTTAVTVTLTILQTEA